MPRLKRAWIGAVAAGLIGLCAGGAGAQINASVNPSADAFVSSASPDSNYGHAGALSVAGSTNNSNDFVSLLRFDLASVVSQFDATFEPGNWQITSASLQLTSASPLHPIFHNPSAAGAIVATWQVNDNWVEGTGAPNAPGATGISFDTLGSVLGSGDESVGSLTYSGSTSGATVYPLTLTDGFRADLTAGGLVSLRLSPGDVNVSGVFNSLNFTNPLSRPLLTIAATAIPEPGSATLLLALVLCIMQARRRTKPQPPATIEGC